MEEKKGTSATRAKNKYKDKTYDRMEIVVPKGDKEKIQEFAKANNKSVNSFITELINNAMGGTSHSKTPNESRKGV